MGNSFNVGGRAAFHVFASSKSWIEGSARLQLQQVSDLPGVTAVAGMPDLHRGKYGPVGCALSADRVFPQFVGSDIGCGMGLFALDISARKLRVDRLAERLGVLDGPWEGEIVGQRIVEAGLALSDFDGALGSIGGGNHFCEVQAIEEIVDVEAAESVGLDAGAAYVLVHSGSRGLGASILDAHFETGGTALDPGSAAGLAYLARHDHAVRWAALNRAIIAERAAQTARAETRLVADLTHNAVEIVRREDGGVVALHRKGAAAADRGLVPVPGSRGTLSYLMAPAASFPAEALASIAHGAGRKYDRASMHGRIAKKKSDFERLSRNPFGGVVVCEDRDLLLEEAPDAYKNIGRVIEDLVENGLARVVATFRPIVTFKKGRISAARKDPKRDRTRWEDRR